MRHVVLLRGINLVRRNRISMPELRKVLVSDGFRDVATYLQSGNAVVTSGASRDRVAARVHAVIEKQFGLDITVLVRSREDLATVVRRNPLKHLATNPQRYIVTFLSRDLPGGFADDLKGIARQEAFAIIGREVYSWHPDGVGRSPLFERLARKTVGVTGTSRNWATVTALLAMSEPPNDR
jgi:uncharacterized protein (DUF1697 family)